MKDTNSYKGWLNSDFLWKRAVAVFSYSMGTSLVMWLILSVAGLIVG